MKIYKLVNINWISEWPGAVSLIYWCHMLTFYFNSCLSDIKLIKQQKNYCRNWMFNQVRLWQSSQICIWHKFCLNGPVFSGNQKMQSWIKKQHMQKLMAHTALWNCKKFKYFFFWWKHESNNINEVVMLCFLSDSWMKFLIWT